MDISIKENIDLTQKQVSVIGAQRSGMAASRLLAKIGAYPFLSDCDVSAETPEKLSTIEKLGIEAEFGGHSERVFEADLMVVSPGVPQDADIVEQASEKGIPIVSEVELASWFTELPIAAITGSNGKTTTTSILAEMCVHGNYTPFLAGNIGVPFSGTVADHLGSEPDDGIYVLEISSFQMEHVHHFRPTVAVLLNLTADHLDRYAGISDYARAKMRIVENMTVDDFVIFNSEDRMLKRYLDTEAVLVPFSLQKNPDALFNVNETRIYDESQEVTIYLKDLSLPGRHNVANFLAAATAGKILGVPLEGIRKVMKTFGGVAHRLEFVRTLDGIDYYNDSKATNVDSVKVALDSFAQPIVLIMGGRDKGADFRELLLYLQPNVKEVLVLGEAANRIREVLAEVVPCKEIDSLPSAVFRARERARPGDVVLLSPGCASFDMFKDFEERGDVFKGAVLSLEGEV